MGSTQCGLGKPAFPAREGGFASSGPWLGDISRSGRPWLSVLVSAFVPFCGLPVSRSAWLLSAVPPLLCPELWL